MKLSVVSRLSAMVDRLVGSDRQRTTDHEQQTATRMHQPQKVRLFIKPFCGWCAHAMDWLDNQGIKYDVFDVIADGKAYEEMYRLSGQTQAPVIDVDGRILADFGARELAAFWRSLPQDRS